MRIARGCDSEARPLLAFLAWTQAIRHTLDRLTQACWAISICDVFDHRRLLLRRPPMPAIIVLRPSVKTISLRSATRQTVESLHLPRLSRATPRHVAISIIASPTERGHQTARAGHCAGRTRPQLQCKPSHDFASRGVKFSSGEGPARRYEAAGDGWGSGRSPNSAVWVTRPLSSHHRWSW
jgi:hypothetical protein